MTDICIWVGEMEPDLGIEVVGVTDGPASWDLHESREPVWWIIVKTFLVIVFACSILVLVNEAFSTHDASSEKDSGMKASIAGRWGFAAVGKDENSRMD